MASSLSLFVTFAILATSWAHLCLVSPPQRGSMNGLNKPGSNDCFLVKGPCGGRSAQTGIALRAGQQFNVTFQKNLSHFLKSHPGFFTVGFGSKGSMMQLAKLTDTSDPSLHLYTTSITVPILSPGKYILQATYVTNNPQAPAEFFQCSDVTLLGRRHG